MLIEKNKVSFYIILDFIWTNKVDRLRYRAYTINERLGLGMRPFSV